MVEKGGLQLRRIWPALLLMLLILVAWRAQEPKPASPPVTVGSSKRSPYISLCLSVKDEHQDLPEWVEHHLALGVGKIYVVDHASKPPLSTVLQRWIADGSVEYTWMEGIPKALQQNYTRRGFPTMQLYVYDWCMERYRFEHTWMGMLDADEYVILRPDIPDLPTLLKRYEAYGGLSAYWRVIGSSGHKKRPKGGVRKSFTNCQPPKTGLSYTIKTFLNLRDVLPTLGDVGPHTFLFRDGKYQVDSKFRRAAGESLEEMRSGLGKKPVFDEIQVYHYMLRSEEEFKKKLKRGNGMGWSRDDGVFELNDKKATEECREALRYVGGGKS